MLIISLLFFGGDYLNNSKDELTKENGDVSEGNNKCAERADVSKRLFETFTKFKGFSFHQSANSFDKKEMPGKHGLILFLIEDNSIGVPVSYISSKFNVTLPTVSQMIGKLEENGFIIRSIDDKDRRVIRVRLTEKGIEKRKKMIKHVNMVFAGLTDHLGLEESRQLATLLAKALDYLQLLCK